MWICELTNHSMSFHFPDLPMNFNTEIILLMENKTSPSSRGVSWLMLADLCKPSHFPKDNETRNQSQLCPFNKSSNKTKQPSHLHHKRYFKCNTFKQTIIISSTTPT
jgi:hypothetical protein